MKVLRGVAAIVLALGVVTGAAAASNDGKTAATAMSLSGTVAGNLTGSAAGAFDYYTFPYPGDGSTATLSLNFTPDDPTVSNAVGVALWQGGTEVTSVNGVGSTPGSNSVTFSSTTSGPVLVQVYNYDDGVPVQFQLSLSGVAASAATSSRTAPSASTPAASSASTSANGSASRPFSLTGAMSGSLPGNSAGSYVYYSRSYPGDGSTASVTLTFSPNGADVANGIYVVAYQNGSQIASAHGTDATTPGSLSISYSSTTSGPVVLQIGNYNPDATISYSISP